MDAARLANLKVGRPGEISSMEVITQPEAAKMLSVGHAAVTELANFPESIRTSRSGTAKAVWWPTWSA